MSGALAPELDAAYRQCARDVRHSAGNFYYAFQLLPAAKRRALHAVYRFCRNADDIADGQGPATERRDRLEAYRLLLVRALEGTPTSPEWLTLADSADRFHLDPQHLHGVIDGCRADCAPLLIRTEADLKRYSFGVAGTVGLLSARIFGYSDPRVEALAVELGEAMQLTNILRDLAEDLGNDRCYLPQEDIDRFSLTMADLLQGTVGPHAVGYRSLMSFEAGRADRHFAEGLKLVPLVDRDARGCPAALAALYRRLLVELRRRGFDVQSGRVSLGPGRKVSLALSAWLRATLAP
ncbi:MAG: phytoene/squalene synthase family protein [Candidatus Dormibacteria bacterium]